MRIIIEGKQGEGKTRLANAICAILRYGGKTFRLTDDEGRITTDVLHNVKPDVEIVTRQK